MGPLSLAHNQIGLRPADASSVIEPAIRSAANFPRHFLTVAAVTPTSTATHTAQVQKMTADAAKSAALAQQNAATAQKVAATARKAAAEASDWAKKANASATQAQGYADQAAKHAKDAEDSAARAAASAKTARDAAKSADIAAGDAARSAADATLSSEMAQASASSAWYSADQAQRSAVAAGEDAAGALKAATEAFSIAVTKLKEEEEARRKAAVEAKEKALSDPGKRAREVYRCNSGYIPCEPGAEARWCLQNEMFCEITAVGPAFNAAMKKVAGAGKDLLGLGELEVCLQNKDLESCSDLAIDVLIGAKLKVLERAYDALTLLKRGCKIVGKSSRAALTSHALFAPMAQSSVQTTDVWTASEISMSMIPTAGTGSPTSTSSREGGSLGREDRHLR